MPQSNLMEHLVKSNFPKDIDLIHLFVGGSTLHGAKVIGYDDLDIYGCYIEQPERVLGLRPIEHYVYSTGSQKTLNVADDVDITCYSLNRWGQLIMKGNPAILHYLYAKNTIGNMTEWTSHIVPYREFLISKRAARQYMGYANSQRMRLTCDRGIGRHGQRPDLIEKYGYDTKFAMHYIRLLYECRELLRDRYISLPRPEKEHLIAIRTGKFSQDNVFQMGKDLENECNTLLAETNLRDEVNQKELSKLISETYLAHWLNNGYIKTVGS